MKRLLQFVLLPLSLTTIYAAPKYLGDVNRDGTFDASDVTAIGNVLEAMEGATGETLLFSDANADGVVDSADHAYITGILLGIHEPKRAVSNVASATVSFVAPVGTVSLGAESVTPAVVSFAAPADPNPSFSSLNVLTAKASFAATASTLSLSGKNAVQLGVPSFGQP